MKFFGGESTGGDKYSPATAADELRTRPEVKRNWHALMACSEAEIKKVFTKLNAQKKKSLKQTGAQALLASNATATVNKRKRGPHPKPKDKLSVVSTNGELESLEGDLVPDDQLHIGRFEGETS
jgi:hypothetical protein